MVRVLDVDTQSAIRNRNILVPRNFVVLTAKDRDDDSAVVHGFWNDIETVSVDVVDENGDETTRTFVGDASILRMDSIPMRIGIEVRTIQIELNPANVAVQNAVRRDDPRQGKVEIYRGLLDPSTNLLVAPPRLRFLGKVNAAPIDTPGPDMQSMVTLRVTSHTRELTRTNSARKSDAQQQLRSGDRFRRYINQAGEWPIFWGEAKS